MRKVERGYARLTLVLPLALAAACQANPPRTGGDSGAASVQTTSAPSLPPGAADARARLSASPRHAEWVVVRTSQTDSVRAWVVFPERNDKAPVVVVIHEIFGLSNWIRAVADQLAADGFIAIAPDLLTMKGIPNTAEGEPDPDSARAAIRTLRPEDVHRDILAVARYGMSLPAAQPRYGIVGFCWGGSIAFSHAAASPELGAAVVYYGASPPTEDLSRVRAPVLGLYGENDARVNATIPPADSAMKALGKTYEHRIFPGAGHGFLRAQDGQGGANLAASREAWPLTVDWFRRHLEREPRLTGHAAH
ncbi:MAG TPA: dienelactone hydrolase family protein [Longimicrobiales bacterium]